ncbi:MAG: alpha/beta hydrolase [Idiomarina sp.]|nr:alpha/beta hydrolase [Idiomarina sp.]
MTKIVALHSSQSHSGQWRFLAKALRTLRAGSENDSTNARPSSAGVAFPVPEFVAADLVGYGKGAPLTKPVAEFRLADELAMLQNAHQFPENPFAAHTSCAPGGAEPVFLIGHSYGGAAALRWALTYPEQVQGLVLYEPVSFHVLAKNTPARQEIVDIARQMDERSNAEAAAAFVDYWNQPGYFAKLPEAARTMMIAQQTKVQADFHALIDEPTALAEYAAIQCPVVLFHGVQSPLSSRTVAENLANTLPNCIHLDVDAGHMAPLVAADKITPLLINALRSMQAIPEY